MNRQAIQTRYLLGKLTDAESASLEERSFVDDNVFDEIEIAEDELIDAYVDGSLSAEDRERFENRLLKSARIAERVEFARLLSESRSSQVMVHEPAKRSWWPGFLDISFGANPALSAAATALLLVVLGLPVFVWMQMRFEGRLARERAASEQQQQQQEQQRQKQERELAVEEARTKSLEDNLKKSQADEERLKEQLRLAEERQRQSQEQLAKNNPQPTDPRFPLVYSGSTRGSGQATILRAPSIPLRLVLDTDKVYVEYRAKIISSADDDVLDRDLITTRSGRSKILIFNVPATDLPPDVYQVRVTGRTSSGTYENVGNYLIRVVEK